MGKFTYNAQTATNFDDRILADRQIAIATKMRRGEGLLFTWKDDAGTGQSRSSVWMHSGVLLILKFHGSRQPDINPEWLDALILTANSPHGLYLVSEPAALTARERPVLRG